MRLRLIFVLVLFFTAQLSESRGQSPFKTSWTLNRGHNGEVLDVAVSPNGKFGATTSADHSIMIWDLESQKIFAKVAGLTSPVSAIDFASDNIHFVTGDMSGKIFIRSIKSPDKAIPLGTMATTGKPMRILPVSDIAWHPTENTVIASAPLTPYAIWKVPELRPGDAIGIDLLPPNKQVEAQGFLLSPSLSVSADGKRIAILKGRGAIEIVSWPDLSVVKTLKYRSSMNASQFSLNHDGTKLVAGTQTHINVWNLAGNTSIKSIKSIKRGNVVGFLSGDKSVWSCGGPDVWSLDDGKLTHSFATKKQKRPIFTAAAATHDNLLLAGTKYGDVQLIRLGDTPSILASWSGIGTKLDRIEFSDDGQTMLLGSNIRDANRYPQKQSTVVRLTSDGGPIMSKLGEWHLTPNGRQICRLDPDPEKTNSSWAKISEGVFDTPPSSAKRTYRNTTGLGPPVSFLSNGDALFAGNQFAADGDKVAQFVEPVDGSRITANATTPNGKIVATGHGGKFGSTFEDFTVGKATLYDLETGKLIRSKKFNFSQVLYVNFSPSGSLAILGLLDVSIIWNLADGEILKRIPYGGLGVFTSEETVIIYGGNNDIVEVNIVGGEVTKKPNLPTHLASIGSGSRLNPHSPSHLKYDSSRQLFSIRGVDDRTSRLWEAISGKVVGKIPQYQRQVFICGKTKRIFSNHGLGNSPERVFIFDFENNKVGSLDTLPFGSLKAVSRDGTSLLYAEANLKPGLAAKPQIHAIYDAQSGKRLRELGKFELGYVATFSKDDKHIVLRSGRQFELSSAEPKIHVLDALTGKTISTIRSGAWNLPDLCFSPDGKRMLVAANVSPATLRRFGEWTTMEKLPDPPEKVKEVQELTRSWDAVKLWDTRTGKILGKITGHESQVDRLRFSNDGTRLMAQSRDKTTLWDVESNKRVSEFRSESLDLPVILRRPIAVKFDDEMNQIYTLREGKIEVLKGMSGEKICEMDPIDGFWRGQFLSKNQFLSIDSVTARLFDFSEVPERKLTASFRSDSPIIAAEKRPSHLELATIHADATVRFWNLSSGEEIIRIQLFDTPKKWLAHTPNGQFTGSAEIDESLSPVPAANTNSSKSIIKKLRNERILESLEQAN